MSLTYKIMETTPTVKELSYQMRKPPLNFIVSGPTKKSGQRAGKDKESR